MDLEHSSREELLEEIKKLREKLREKVLSYPGLAIISKYEKLLSKKEEESRSLIEQASDAIIICDSEGNIQDGNKRTELLLGYPQQVLLQKNLRDLINYHDSDPLLIENLKESGIIREKIMLRYNGESFPAEISAKRLKDGRIQSIIRDISERKRNEAFLKESEAYHKKLFSESPVAMICIDSTSEDILEVNQAAVDLYMIPASEWKGLNYADLLAEQHGKEPGTEIHKDIAGRKLVVKVSQAKLPDNKSVAVIQDVTESIRLQKENRERALKYSQLFQFANDGIYILENGVIVECNSRFEEMLGEKKENILGKSPMDLSPQYQSEGLSSKKRSIEIERRIVSGEKFTFQWVHQKADGTAFHAEISVSSYRQDKHQYIQAIVRDITEFKLAESQIKISEKSYRDLFDRSADMILILDQEGRFLDVNKAVLEKYGLDKGEVIGRHYTLMSAHGLNDEVKINHLFGTTWKDEATKFDWWCVTTKGEIFPKEVLAEKGHYFGREVIIATCRDISDRLAGQKAITESREKYRNLIRSLHLGVLILRNYRIYFANDYACKLLGFQSNQLNELLGKPISLFTTTEKAEDILREEGGEFLVRAIDGTTKNVKIQSAVTDFEGETAFQLILEDLSEIRATEEELREQQANLALILNNIDYVTYNFTYRENELPDISFVSRQVENILGLTPAEFIEQTRAGTYRNLYHPDDMPAIIKAGHQIKNGDKAIHILYRVKNPKTGKFISLEESLFLQDESNGVTYFGIAKDVTSRVKADGALKESETRYRNLVERNLAGVFVTDSNRIITSCNDAFARILGFSSSADVIGKATHSIYEESSDKHDFLKKLGKKGFLTNHESHVKLHDGREVWLLENASMVYDSDGNPEGVEGTLIEITEWKKAEENLHKREKQYRSLFENNLAGVFRTSVEGEFLEVNEAFVKVFGYERKEELQGLSAQDLYFTQHERDEYINTLLKQKKLTNYQIRCRRKDGKEIWVLANVAVQQEEEREVVEGTLIDITQLIRTQRTLSISEKKFRQLSEASPIGIFLTDEAGKILFVNREVEKIAGLSGPGLFDITLDSLLQPADISDFASAVETGIRDKSAFAGEYRAVIAGETRWISVNSTILHDERGELTGWVGTLEDITSRKLSEERVRESEKRFRLLSEAAIEGIVFSEEGIIIDVNDRFVAMHGYADRREVIGQPLTNFLQDTGIRKISPEGDGKQTALELRSRRKDGSLITLEARGETIPFYGRSIRISVLYDVSERKKYEEALRESERALATLMANLPGMAYRCKNDKFWTMDFVSSGATQLTGYTPEELVKNKTISFLKVIHPEDAPRLQSYVQERIRERKSFTLEYRIIHKSGEERWVWEQGEGVFDKKGNLRRIEGFISDITARKQYEQQLQLSREGYRSLVENSPMGILLLRNLQVIYSNDKAKEMFNDPQGKILSGSLFEYILPEYREKIKARAEIAMAGEPQAFEEVKMKLPDGKIRDLETASSRVYYEGEPTLQVVIQDISLRKALEKEYLRAEVAEDNNRVLQKEIDERIRTQRLLTEAQKFTRSIIDSSLDMICATDKNGKLIEFNQAAEKVFKVKRENMIGRPLPNLYARKEDFLRVTRAVQDTGTYSGEVVNRDSEGQTFTSYLSASILRNEEGEIIGSMGVSRDITALKQAENELRQSREHYRALFSQAFIGIARVGLDGKFLQTNQRLCDMLGYSPTELQDISFHELPHPDDPAPEKDYLAEVIDGNRDNFSEQRQYTGKAGNTIHANLTVSLVRDSTGDPDYLVIVLEDVTEQIRAQAKIGEQAARLRAVFESSTHILYTLNREFELVSFNANFARLYKEKFGASPQTGKRFLAKARALYESGGETVDIKKIFTEAFSSTQRQFELKLKLGEKISWQEAFVNPVILGEEEVREISVLSHDVTEKRMAEEKIRESLREKEVLLKEVHHRVKNNLQVISSILNLQSAYVTDDKTLGILRESQNRIKSMAFIHESLYQTADITRIDFAEYLSNLARNLVHSYSLTSTRVSLDLDIQPLLMGLDASIPCGLIINELLSNSLKYAFEDQKEGKIFILLRHENDLVSITVGDDGKGLPVGFNINETNTLGLQLVTTLVDQVNGELEIMEGKGAVYRFSFKLSQHVKD